MSSDDNCGKPKKIAFENEIYKSGKKYPGFWKNFKDYFSDYSRLTTLNGFQYLGEQDRSTAEKIWWIIVIAASLWISTLLIFETYAKWNNSPVIVSFAQSPTPVWQIPFPAITICSETKSRQTKFNVTHYYHKILQSENMTDEEKGKYSNVALLCDNHVYTEGSPVTDVEVVNFISEIAPPFEESMWQCKWTNNNESCDTMFTKMLSEEGVCFSFNMLDRDEIYTDEVFHNKDFLELNKDSHGWSLETGYARDAGIDTFPRRAMSAGITGGLTVLLRAFEKDLDYVCRGPVQGFKILLHHPGEVPRVSMQYFRAPLDQEVVVTVKPDMMTTSVGLRGYDPKRRSCYFSEEKHLRFYKKYTQQNCDVECLTNVTLRKCGCVAYHMPHVENTPICGSGSILCMRAAQIDVVAGEVETGLSGIMDGQSCGCLPACTSLVYNAETSQADFNWPKVFQAYKANFSEFPGIRMTRVQFFFKEFQFITSERNELYGVVDFLASVGGLLGLFIGFSFISLVEVVYYLTIRMWVNIKRYGRHYWSGSEELLQNDVYLHPHLHKKKT